MDFTLSEEQRQIRETIVRFARAELNEGVIDRDREGRFPRELWSKCGELKLQGLAVPEAWGGAGLDPLTTAVALEAFGYGCEDGGLVFSVCAHLLACGVPLAKYGTEDQKRRWLPGLCDGSLIAVNGMTEPDTGSDPFAMSTSARPDGDGWVLRGSKVFGSNAPVADLALVFARTDPEKGFNGGITAFFLETSAPGVTVAGHTEKMGLRTSPMGELVLDDVRVGSDALLGGVGAGGPIFSHSMDWERTCLFASHVGTMERLLEKAVAHARVRKQSGKPIGAYQAVSHRLADMKVRLEAARLLVYRAASVLEVSRRQSFDASIAKLFVSEAYRQSALDAIQVFGGYGFTTEYEIERTARDAVGATLYSGTSEVQRNIIARWLGLPPAE